MWQQLKKQVKLRCGSLRPTPMNFITPTVELTPAVEETHNRVPHLVKSNKGDVLGRVITGKCGGENKENLTAINVEKHPKTRGESHGSGRSGCD